MNSLPLVMQLSLNVFYYFRWNDIECKMRQDKLFTSTVEDDTGLNHSKACGGRDVYRNASCATNKKRYPITGYLFSVWRISDSNR